MKLASILLATLLTIAENGKVSVNKGLTLEECKVLKDKIISFQGCTPSPHVDTPECKGRSGTQCGGTCSYYISPHDIIRGECLD